MRPTILAVAIVSFILVPFTVFGAQTLTTFTLHGEVRRSDGNNPTPNAVVKVSGVGQAVTDRFGKFRINVPKGWTGTLEVERFPIRGSGSYYWIGSPVIISRPVGSGIDVGVLKLRGNKTVKLTLEARHQNGIGVNGATFKVKGDGHGKVYFAGKADQSGRVVVELLAGESVDISIALDQAMDDAKYTWTPGRTQSRTELNMVSTITWTAVPKR